MKKKRARGELRVRERERRKGKEQGEEGRRARPGSVVVVAVGAGTRARRCWWNEVLGDERAEEGIDGSNRLGTEFKEEGIRWQRRWTDGTNGLKSRD